VEGSPGLAAGRPSFDLLARTAELVNIPSVSFHEAGFTDTVEAELRSRPWLHVTRVGDNVVARTELGRKHRVLLGGHSDTVPANGNEQARLLGDTCHGLGAADMKGGIAVLLALAADLPAPAVDVTYLIYAREEVGLEHNGLRELAAARPDLLAADVALLGEPTSGIVEAGCQGTMRYEITLRGARAHTARPWMGRNAIHRLGALLRRVEEFPERQPIIDGCTYREALQAVRVEGGVANNVVPDCATVTINHRLAPDRTLTEADAIVREWLAPVLEPGDEVLLRDQAPPAPPGLHQPLLAAFIAEHELSVEAKLGWTDVAFFAELGVPAANLGPGDALLAHTADERITRDVLESTYARLRRLLEAGMPTPARPTAT
jgi:succinyl-diaminopimelate desuccinylase